MRGGNAERNRNSRFAFADDKEEKWYHPFSRVGNHDLPYHHPRGRCVADGILTVVQRQHGGMAYCDSNALASSSVTGYRGGDRDPGLQSGRGSRSRRRRVTFAQDFRRSP